MQRQQLQDKLLKTFPLLNLSLPQKLFLKVQLKRKSSYNTNMHQTATAEGKSKGDRQADFSSAPQGKQTAERFPL